MASFYDETCNPFNKTGVQKSFIFDSVMHISVNVFFGILTVLCLSVDYESSDKITGAGLGYKSTDDDENNEKAMPIQKEESENQITEVPTVYQSNYYIWFHFIMAVFSIYLVMIFFDWRELNINMEHWGQLLAPSPSAFFIKTISNFLFVMIYVWTLVAPGILHNRDFTN